MKRFLLWVFSFLLFFAASCNKERFAGSDHLLLLVSDTALHFDTIFTTTGSVTKVLKLFNINSQPLRISNLELSGGTGSFFKINVNGVAGVSFQNIDIDAGDSAYVFVSVAPPQNNQQLPFLVEDSIRLDVGGNMQHVKLDAYGQNAYFLRSKTVLQDTTWTGELPIVLLDSFSVAQGATLTIQKGVRVYCHANTPLMVEGSLVVNGGADSADRVVFAGDRLDEPYKNQPGTWEGIYFRPGSTGNVLNYAIIENAKQGVAADAGSRISLNECLIDNCSDAGIIANNSVLNAVNCLVSNCSSNVYLVGGGTYRFLHCTLAAYGTSYFSHQYPALFASNAYDNEVNPLTAVFRNCIVTGEDFGLVPNEVELEKTGSAGYEITFENCLYRNETKPSLASFTNCLQSVDPLFSAVIPEKNIFDFHLQSTSPCVNAGLLLGINNDLDGKAREAKPDMGCYEAQQ